MPVTFSQKLAVLALPAGAVVLAWATSTPDWNPKSVRGSLREAAAAKARPAPEEAKPAEAPPPPPAPEAKHPSGKGKKKGNGAPPLPVAPAEAPPPAPPAEKPSAPETPPAPPPAPPAPSGPPEIEFRVTALATCRTAETLTIPTSQRLDIHVMVSGAVRLGPDFADPEKALGEIRAGASEKKRDGLLFLVPNKSAPWDSVRDLAAAGVAANWTRVGLCVAAPENPGQGRLLLLDVPATEAPTKKGIELLTVKVLPGSGFELNGEKCDTPEALGKKAKAFHQDYEEGFEAGYSSSPDETPWTVDGAGATAGGVVAALDALRQAGVKAVRIAGVRREGTR